MGFTIGGNKDYPADAIASCPLRLVCIARLILLVV